MSVRLSPSFRPFARWFMSWRRKPASTALPLGLTPAEVEALSALQSTPHWPHYLRVIERLGETQAAELTSGLAHDRYLFACGALTALRRVFTLVDDILAAANKLEEVNNARTDRTARESTRRSAAFLNTPFWDGSGRAR